MLLRMFGKIQVSCDRFRCVFVVFFYFTKMFSESVAKLSPCFAGVYFFLQRLQVMQSMTLAEVQVKRSVMLMARLGPDIFSTL